jgi:hypothetical protein
MGLCPWAEETEANTSIHYHDWRRHQYGFITWRLIVQRGKTLSLPLYNELQGGEPFSWSQQLLVTKEFPPTFYGTKRFISVSTRPCQWSLSWDTLIRSIPTHIISLWFILILSTHLRQGLSSGLSLSGFPTKTLYAFVFAPIRATCPAKSHTLLTSSF